MAAPSPQTVQFLDAVFGAKPPSEHVVLWTLPNKQTRRFTDLTDAARYAALCDEAGYDVYVGVGLQRHDLGRGERGKAADVTGLCGLWADIDIAGPGHESAKVYPPTEDDALSLLDAVEEPSLVVNSGHGFHVWWLFSEPWVFADASERQQAAQAAQALSRHLQDAATARGWQLDSTADLSRVLRIPGTHNRKAAPVEVWLSPLLADGVLRYDRHQLMTKYAQTSPPPLRLVRPPTGAGAAQEQDEEGFIVNADALPPHEKLAALREVDPKFAAVLDHRKAFPSASERDLAIANVLVSAEMTDQEIVDTLIATRRQHNDREKLRPDYFGRTIAKARQQDRQRQAMAVLDGPVQNAADPKERAHRFAALSEVLGGAEVTGLVKFGVEKALYSFVLVDGREALIGESEDLYNPDKVRSRMANYTLCTLDPGMKKPAWQRLIAGVLSLATVEENPTGEPLRELRAWLSSYVNERALTQRKDADGEQTKEFAASFRNGDPFQDGDRLFVQAEKLKAHIRHTYDATIELHLLRHRLRQAGFASAPLTVYVSAAAGGKGKAETKSYWSGPLSFVEEASGAAEGAA